MTGEPFNTDLYTRAVILDAQFQCGYCGKAVPAGVQHLQHMTEPAYRVCFPDCYGWVPRVIEGEGDAQRSLPADLQVVR